MENKKLTKELLDKVRHIEGFPKGKDENIIELSDPPYYTACPNPFIQDFIDEHGTPYDEETDDYHREPFASDVSEGKNDPIYNAHPYHTKVPHKAIMKYILHYTKPGDIVLDGFCGTGMTGIAAQMCKNPDMELRLQLENEMDQVKWGYRKAILGDLSPLATFVAYNYNVSLNIEKEEEEAYRILEEVEKECGWMYETQHALDGKTQKDFSGKPIMGKINYIIWSDVFICPYCHSELVFWDIAVDRKSDKVRKEFNCFSCKSNITKKDLERVWVKIYDKEIKKNIKQIKQVPVLIKYSVEKKRFEKRPDEKDIRLIKKIENLDIPYWFPTERMPVGEESRRNDRIGYTHVHHFFTKRDLYVISLVFYKVLSTSTYNRLMLLILTSLLIYSSKLSRWRTQNKSGPLSGTLYISATIMPLDAFNLLRNRTQRLINAKKQLFRHFEENLVCISTQSLTDLKIKENSIDYIFTDPPFGSNLMYSELNFLWEAWLKVFTNNELEAIINKVQKKGLNEYQVLMDKCFSEMCRILKPGRWLTMVFHNSKNSVWNAIQEALLKAGFLIADVRLLDKQQGSFKQVTTTSAVKKDLVVSAYKPKEAFIKEFNTKAGSEEGVWEFISQHLEKLPVAVKKDDLLSVVVERQKHLLYDRMVAFHIQNGYSVPMGVADFFEGLKQKFPERDGMYFLPEQAAEYDKKRLKAKGVGQLSLFISGEKSAIQWVRFKLEERPLTYQEIQPDFMREANFYRHEKSLELQEILEQNFLQDEKGRWYVPDPNKQADLEKLRERALLREFGEYKESRGKLKKFRTEAVRAGFKHCWSNGDYKTIIEIAKRIPDNVLQEDASLLMYYNNALTREGQK